MKWIVLFIAVIILSSGCENTVNSKKDLINDKEIENDNAVVSDEENDVSTELDESNDLNDENTIPDEYVDDYVKPDNDFIWDNCSETYDCESNEMCVKEIGKCKDVWGHCEVIPESCGEIYSPVCGCDNVTYSNECEARKLLQNIAYDGECK